MAATPEDIARSMSTHDFGRAMQHLAEDVVWRPGGDEPIVGRDAVIRACTDLAAELDGVQVDLRSVRVIAAGAAVVVETLATYTAPGGDTSAVASCDLYDFAGDDLIAISSYNVEVAVD
jgi:ketosteroid isomerase-like protein